MGRTFKIKRKRGVRFGLKNLFDLALLGLILGGVLCAVCNYAGTTQGTPPSGFFSGSGNWATLARFLLRPVPDGGYEPGFLLVGLGNTLRISLWTLLLAGFIGLTTGFFSATSIPFLRMLAASYVGLVRNIPPLILVLVVYYFGGFILESIIPWDAIGAWLDNIPGIWILVPPTRLSSFFSAVLALGLSEGAYFSEVVRGGILSVPKGQWEAAASLGLPKHTQVFSVILPQAFRLMLPPLVNQTVSLFKGSAIVSVISIRDLTFQGRELINSTYMVLEVWLTVTLLYFLVSLGISLLGALLEKRIKWTP